MFHTSLVRDMLLLYGQPQQVPYTIITEQVLYATGNVPSWHTAAHVLLQAMPEHVPFLRSTLHVPMRPKRHRLHFLYVRKKFSLVCDSTRPILCYCRYS